MTALAVLGGLLLLLFALRVAAFLTKVILALALVFALVAVAGGALSALAGG